MAEFHQAAQRGLRALAQQNAAQWLGAARLSLFSEATAKAIFVSLLRHQAELYRHLSRLQDIITATSPESMSRMV
jgi:hypothetical protein